MRFINLGTLALCCTTSIAYEVTIYNDVDDCNAGDLTEYRIITGAATGGNGIDVGVCNNFDQAMPDTDCAQYTFGGGQGPAGCDSGSLLPQSILAKNENRPCFFYEEPDCAQPGRVVWDSCITAKDEGWQRFKSFRCDWDGTVDILGNVGCGNGVSTNVCINDCDCSCSGQSLDCPAPDSQQLPTGCTPMAAKLCNKNCLCTNPKRVFF